MASALTQLGYHVCGAKNDMAQALLDGNIEAFIDVARKYDAFEDDPWPLLYKEMDKAFPGSKFILTERDADSWYKSCLNHFYEDTTPIRDYIYGDGSPKDHEDTFKRKYNQHILEVKEYFKGREKDFLIVNWTKGDSWEKLCTFLDIPVPSTPFPHANKGLYTGNPKGLRKRMWMAYKNAFAFLYHKVYKRFKNAG